LNDLTQQMLRLKKRKVKQKKKIHCFAFKQKIHQKIFLYFQLDCLTLTKSFSKSSSLNLRRSQLRHQPKIVQNHYLQCRTMMRLRTNHTNIDNC
jgi:hypothetical protein